MDRRDRIAALARSGWHRYLTWPMWARVLAPVVLLGVLAVPFTNEGDTSNTGAGVQASPHPTSTETPAGPEGAPPVPAASPTVALPRWQLYHRKDVSYDFRALGREAARRLQLLVEWRTYPTSRGALEKVVRQLIQEQRGQGWQAISIAVRYDRAETLPAFGVFEWAPDGDWDNAATGNPDTWDGYRLTANLNDKVDHPEGCSPPSVTAFQISSEFNVAIEAGEDEDVILVRLAQRHNMSKQAARAAVEAVDAWALC